MSTLSTQRLTRKTFTTSRLAEFATVAELIRQTGHPVGDWPLVIVKELADNALDAAEGAGIAPEIEVVLAPDAIAVTDCGGPGIASSTVASLIDYSVRTSSRAAYVSPTRGAQGNALQSIFPMGFALASLPSDIEALVDSLADVSELMGGAAMADIVSVAQKGEQGALGQQQGEVLIESHGVAHRIVFAVDPVRQTPAVNHAQEPSEVKTGTKITVRWPSSASSIIADAESDFLALVSTFAWLNPHLTLSAEFLGSERFHQDATDPGWKKWRPDLPTSPHWYNDERLNRLMTAEIAHAEDNGTACPSVRDFISQFRGLTGSAKARDICNEIGVAERASLADFYSRCPGAVGRLLQAMRSRSRPTKPGDLGVVGRGHLQACFAESGADPETFVYKCVEITHDGLPYVIEAAFALRSGEDDGEGPRVIEGFNFTPAIGGSPFRLEGYLAQARIEDDDPVIVFTHLTSPRLDFLDRGKARVALPDAAADEIVGLVKGVTAKWTKQKKAEIRDRRAFWRREDAMRKRDRPMSTKEAAFEVMEMAYMAASANNTLPANPRQIYYAARPSVLKATGKATLDSGYFTQTLLVDYVEERGVDWDIVWDDRGHFREPHTDHEIGLGTLAVRDYVARLRDPEIRAAKIAAAGVSTRGPAGRYASILFIEKEGFTPVLEAARIPERFDIAPMSTKGMSVTAARLLIDELCGRFGLRLFVLHDFDIAGFSIKKTLTASGRRYTFTHEIIDPVDLGLRLADVERLGLASESVPIDRNEDALERRLRINGATNDEIAFLLSGRRVELNAMTSDVFVRFVEDGLRANGVAKVVPPMATLAETYAAFRRGSMARQALEDELARLNDEIVDTPTSLEQRVRNHLAAHPVGTWDDSIRAVNEEDESNARKRGRS
jgi:hypothetical protein